MRTATFPKRQFLTVLSSILFFQFAMFFQSCKKTVDTPAIGEIVSKRKPHNPPPPPPQFQFTNCAFPTFNGTFVMGQPANVTLTMTYANSPGGSYPAFTSSPVNGITFTTPAGVLNTGTGSIVYTASGTPTNTGYFMMSVSVGSHVGCAFVITVLNPVPSGPDSDPGTVIGSTGLVNFIYKGQPVTYKTVRAKDGRIWLQHNLGSPQVAMHETDNASAGDYFQWGRWDDGHQVRNSPTITGGPSLMNPSHIPSGNPSFITGTTASTKWWGVGGLASDTWSGTTASSTNGKDPCVALGAGWRLPTAAEWQNIAIREDLFGTIAAYQSNLKLPSSGYRGFQNGNIGYYWTSTATDNSNAQVFFFDDVYNAGVTVSARGEGFSCRCIKD